MKILLQRVTRAAVEIEGEVVASINQGLLVLVAIEMHDTETILTKMCSKLLNYRVFSDQHGKMNLSVLDVEGDVLLVSQFTLAASTTKGLRPSFSGSAPPDKAKMDYDYFVQCCRARVKNVATGVFAADMQVSLVNDGPVTFLLEA